MSGSKTLIEFTEDERDALILVAELQKENAPDADEWQLWRNIEIKIRASGVKQTPPARRKPDEGRINIDWSLWFPVSNGKTDE